MPGIEPFVGEPDKERLHATLRGEIPDRVPHFEALIEDQHVEKLLGRPAGNTLGVGGDPAKGSEAAEGTRPMYPKDHLEFCRIIGQDAMIVENFWTPIKTKNPDGTVALLNDRSFKSRAALDRVVWPDESDMEERLQYVREYVKAAEGTGIGVSFCPPCIFQTLYEFVIGLADTMMMCYEQRDLVEEMLDASADYYERLVATAVGEGLDVFYFADDFAWKNGIMIPPQLFREMWVPRAARLIAPAVNAGVPVFFHSDGKIDDAVDWLIEIGVDGINPMDPYGIDYRDYKKRFGNRVTLSGNIDVERPLVHGTPDDVEQDVIAHMDVLKPGGRYIAGSSHSVTNFVPHENFIAMLNAIHRYGGY